MDKLKLIQQLYEPESSDFGPAMLTPEEESQLEALRSVKRALDRLPRENAREDTILAVKRAALAEAGEPRFLGLVKPIRTTGLRLVRGKALPRLAAVAAVVVVAIGITLWTNQPDVETRRLTQAAAEADSLPSFDLEWDDSEDVRTLYWQVEALHERSAERLWDASIPLESRPVDPRNQSDPGLQQVGAQR